MVILQPLPREAILAPNFWRFSPPVPFVEKPVVDREARDPGLPEAELPVLWAALDAIDNDGPGLDYDSWRDVIYGVHWATGGSAEGLAKVEEWSARSSKYVAGYGEAKVWDYADQHRAGGITAATVFKHATRFGWVNPATSTAPDLEGFEVAGAAAVHLGVDPIREASTSNDPVGLHISPQSLQTVRAATTPARKRPAGYEPPTYPARDKKGVILPTVENAILAVADEWEAGMQVGYDAFRDELMVQPAGADLQWRPIRDADFVRLRVAMERAGFKVAPKELARDAAIEVAERNQFDSAQLWLDDVATTWDGEHRCEHFLAHAFGAADTPYTRAVSLYIWTALAGRVLAPGVQADMAPILEGGQGLRKTSALAAMVPDRLFFSEIDLQKDEDALARMLRGTLVCEISELKGLHTKDQESIKAWVSRRYEKWVPKFKEFATVFPRRCVLFGTTNRTDLLSDETGNRRWLPVHVTRAAVEWIEQHREQLWAEGAAIFRGVPKALDGAGAAGNGYEGGVAWREAERLSAPAHVAYRRSDPWEGPFVDWIARSEDLQAAGDVSAGVGTVPRSGFTMDEVLAGALGMPLKEMSTQAQMRAGAVLKTLGFAGRDKRVDGRMRRVWVRVDPADPVSPL